LQALELGSETTGSHALDPLFKKIHENIQHGHSLTDALKEQQFFPLTVVHMIEVGEATGQLPKMLLNIAELYEQELKTDLALILTLLEPATILLIALTVGTLIVALFLPLVTMMGELGS
jgi:type IV pilus assembly protein PilC